MKSFFLDMSIEAEGLYQDYTAGLVIGFTYSPHFTFKVQLHSKEYFASAEGKKHCLCSMVCRVPLVIGLNV